MINNTQHITHIMRQFEHKAEKEEYQLNMDDLEQTPVFINGESGIIVNLPDEKEFENSLLDGDSSVELIIEQQTSNIKNDPKYNAIYNEETNTNNSKVVPSDNITGRYDIIKCFSGNCYKLGQLIGRGGNASVYNAKKIGSMEEYAVKIPSDYNNHRIHQEYIMSREIKHKNFVSFEDFACFDGQMFLIMPYIKGITLQKYIESKQQILISTVCIILHQILELLKHFASINIIHRDLKNSNIILFEGNIKNVKVIDLGIGKSLLADSDLTVENNSSILGSLSYISPEQFSQPAAVSIATDMYSTGVIAYEMLTKTLPIETNNNSIGMLYELKQKHIAEPVINLRQDTPKLLSSLISQMLEIAPEKRPVPDEAIKILDQIISNEKFYFPNTYYR